MTFAQEKKEMSKIRQIRAHGPYKEDAHKAPCPNAHMPEFVIDETEFSGSDEEESKDDDEDIDGLIDDETDCNQDDAHRQYLQEQAEGHAQEMRKYAIQRAALREMETEKREEREALAKRERENKERRRKSIRKGNCIDSSEDEMNSTNQPSSHQWQAGMTESVLGQPEEQQSQHQHDEQMPESVLDQPEEQQSQHQHDEQMPESVLGQAEEQQSQHQHDEQMPESVVGQPEEQQPPHQHDEQMPESVLGQAEEQQSQHQHDEETPEENEDALSDDELQSSSSGDESDPNDMGIDMPRASEPQNVCHSPSCDRRCAPCRLQMCLTWDKKKLKCDVKKLDFVRLAPDSCGFLVHQDMPSDVTCGSCVLIDAYLHEGVEIPWETITNNPPWLSDAQTMLDSATKQAVKDNAKVDVLAFIRYHVQHPRELQSYAAVDETRELCVAVIAEAIQRLFKEQLSLS